MRICLFAIAMISFPAVVSASSISDLSSWTVVEDPPHAGLSAYSVGDGSVFLQAIGSIASGTDIGCASINGEDVASSSSGFYFDPSSDFAVAVDFHWWRRDSDGAIGFGFGIGEEASGDDSAGVVLGFVDAQPVAFVSAGRVADVNVAPQAFSTLPNAAMSSISGTPGRFFVSYESVSKNVIVGVSNTAGAATPNESLMLPAIAADWNGDPLMLSFFIRSQDFGPVPGMTRGQMDVRFSNFQVLSGTPLTIVPEPTASVLAILGALGVLAVKKRTC